MEIGQSPQKELRDTVSGIKRLLIAGRELGFDCPQISESTLHYMSARAVVSDKDQGEAYRAGSLEELRRLLGDCRRCRLHQGRKNLVFGEGNPSSNLVFVGEGPGREEDMVGRPFVGEAGRLLTRIIAAMDLAREDVYICNIVKCRPPQNRDPKADEVETCVPFLMRQLELIRPKVICTLGRVAGRELLGQNFSTTRDRGKWAEYMGLPVMPTFHPAYLLRNPSAKRPVWEDIKSIMKFLGLGGKHND
jgi:DNA polymerase